MGSANCNLFHISSLCSHGSDNRTFEENIAEYEDKHVRITHYNTKEKENGRIKNETNKVSIFNKDGYYNPKMLLSAGNNLYLPKGD